MWRRHLEVPSFLAPSGQGRKHKGSAAALLLWGHLEETGVHLRAGKLETRQVCGVEAWKVSLSRTERRPWVKLYAKGHMWITAWSFLERGYLGRVNFGFCFTFIFKVEYFSSIGDNGLEKPVSHQLTSPCVGCCCPCLYPTCLPLSGGFKPSPSEASGEISPAHRSPGNSCSVWSGVILCFDPGVCGGRVRAYGGGRIAPGAALCFSLEEAVASK